MPPVLRKGTKAMREMKRKRQEPAMVWTNTMGVVTKDTALRRSKRVQKARKL